eukprot:Blabericola_migrator_1__9784@NODE_536_length_7757_cov_263_784395_g64_i2_p1_GENE_NODE_536_length_7757_cov_263_784395_g64_i2NODE_536_length_7757_cov_263_784395_g64_i2_p1_ORF_typecomplete_len763_score79_73Put_DNAbind_N/PF06971_13/7_4e02Put_DNAbind_N/PF06971_13/3e02Put_DNAbind_N/PF06971_13/19Put_DNAbind_N/PF06971_13/1_4e03NinG/PF05766_12/0_21_NODE_536_length_7757_cov_263_784395_g64_i2452333
MDHDVLAGIVNEALSRKKEKPRKEENWRRALKRAINEILRPIQTGKDCIIHGTWRWQSMRLCMVPETEKAAVIHTIAFKDDFNIFSLAQRSRCGKCGNLLIFEGQEQPWFAFVRGKRRGVNNAICYDIELFSEYYAWRLLFQYQWTLREFPGPWEASLVTVALYEGVLDRDSDLLFSDKPDPPDQSPHISMPSGILQFLQHVQGGGVNIAALRPDQHVLLDRLAASLTLGSRLVVTASEAHHEGLRSIPNSLFLADYAQKKIPKRLQYMAAPDLDDYVCCLNRLRETQEDVCSFASLIEFLQQDSSSAHAVELQALCDSQQARALREQCDDKEPSLSDPTGDSFVSAWLGLTRCASSNLSFPIFQWIQVPSGWEGPSDGVPMHVLLKDVSSRMQDMLVKKDEALPTDVIQRLRLYAHWMDQYVSKLVHQTQRPAASLNSVMQSFNSYAWDYELRDKVLRPSYGIPRRFLPRISERVPLDKLVVLKRSQFLLWAPFICEHFVFDSIVEIGTDLSGIDGLPIALFSLPWESYCISIVAQPAVKSPGAIAAAAVPTRYMNAYSTNTPQSLLQELVRALDCQSSLPLPIPKQARNRDVISELVLVDYFSRHSTSVNWFTSMCYMTSQRLYIILLSHFKPDEVVVVSSTKICSMLRSIDQFAHVCALPQLNLQNRSWPAMLVIRDDNQLLKETMSSQWLAAVAQFASDLLVITNPNNKFDFWGSIAGERSLRDKAVSLRVDHPKDLQAHLIFKATVSESSELEGGSV